MEPIRIRPIRPTDAAGLEAFYRELGDESRRLRFFGVTAGLSGTQSTRFCSTDHAHREGFVATIREPGRPDGERIVGHVCLEPAGPGRAEVAIAVSDAVQRQGIGTSLMRAAIGWARRHRISTLSATMLPTNPAIHGLLRSLGLPARSRPTELGTIALDLAVDPGPALAA